MAVIMSVLVLRIKRSTRLLNIHQLKGIFLNKKYSIFQHTVNGMTKRKNISLHKAHFSFHHLTLSFKHLDAKQLIQKLIHTFSLRIFRLQLVQTTSSITRDVIHKMQCTKYKLGIF